MKKIVLMFLVFEIMANIAIADSKPNVIVSGFSIKGLAAPGSDFILAVDLTNTQSTRCAESVTTSVESGFPFINKGSNVHYGGEICFGDKTTVEFPMRVDPTAVGGFYQVKIGNSYESTTNIQFSTSNTLNIFVNGSPKLKAFILDSKPIDVYPGDTAQLTVSLENDGTFRAESVEAYLVSQGELEVKPQKSFGAIPSLEPKQSKSIDFSIELPKSSRSSSHPLSLKLSYLDENKQRKEQIVSLNFASKKKARFDAKVTSTDEMYANYNNLRVSVELKNTGTNTAKKVHAKIVPLFPFATDGSERYIEEIAPGKSATFDFSIDVDKDAKPGQYSLDTLVQFEDEQGKKLDDTTQLSLEVKSKNFVRAVFIDFTTLWIIALIVFAFIMSKKMKGKKGK